MKAKGGLLLAREGGGSNGVSLDCIVSSLLCLFLFFFWLNDLFFFLEFWNFGISNGI